MLFCELPLLSKRLALVDGVVGVVGVSAVNVIEVYPMANDCRRRGWET